jgi:hypothetical protein
MKNCGRADLLAHHPFKLQQAHPSLPITQPPVERYAEEVGVGHVQLGLERLWRGQITPKFQQMTNDTDADESSPHLCMPMSR